MTDLDKALQHLFSRQRLGVKFGLEIEAALLQELGDPHLGYGVVHVAGTNGKGSVCAMVASALQELGHGTGLYTSPHLVHFNERFLVNGDAISDDDLASLLQDVESAARRVAARIGRIPTFFECSTAMAFEHFRRQKVSLAVIETGLGGRLDATNLCLPLVSAITRISLEHTDFLGTDIESIAAEKAGIIKEGRPVVCGAMPDEARAVVLGMARERNAAFIDVEDTISVRVTGNSFSGCKVSIESASAGYGTARVPLGGLHQAENIATAVAVLETTHEVLGLPLDRRHVLKGLETVQWRGRCQLLEEDPVVVLDGAHNPDAALALGKWLHAVRGKLPVGLVIGMCGDKDVDGFLKQLAGPVARVWAVPVRNERSIEPDLLVAHARQLGLKAEAHCLAEAMRQARQWADREKGMVCVTGSLFLVGELLKMNEKS